MQLWTRFFCLETKKKKQPLWPICSRQDIALYARHKRPVDQSVIKVDIIENSSYCNVQNFANLTYSAVRTTKVVFAITLCLR